MYAHAHLVANWLRHLDILYLQYLRTTGPGDDGCSHEFCSLNSMICRDVESCSWAWDIIHARATARVPTPHPHHSRPYYDTYRHGILSTQGRPQGSPPHTHTTPAPTMIRIGMGYYPRKGDRKGPHPTSTPLPPLHDTY